MNQEVKKQKITWKFAILLQGIVLLFTLSGVAAKLASSHPFLSMPFIFYYGIEIMILGVYAILWQQIIKRVDLSIAYANRAIALLWSMLWAATIFHEQITWNNIVGVLIVIAGTIIVNSDGI